MVRFTRLHEPARVERKELPSPLSPSQVTCIMAMQMCESFQGAFIFPFAAFMVEDFNAAPSPEAVGYYVGILTSSFSFAQLVSSFVWGRAADKIGRKACILCGLLGSVVATLLFGFSTTFAQAVAGRVAAGLLNGNVGVMKSLLAARTNQHNRGRAFSFITLSSGLGAVIAPVVGGLLARPVRQYPALFARESAWGRWEYLLPSLIVALVWNLIYLVDAPVARAGVPAMQPPAPAATAATPSAEQQRLLSRSEARADAWVELAPRPPKSGMTPVPPAGAGPLPEEPQAGGHARDPSSVLPPSAAADEAAGSPVVSTAGINASAPVPVVVVELPAGTELRPTSPAEGDVERQPLVMVASPEEANADSNGCGSSGGGSGSESSSDRDGGAGSGSLCTGGRGGNGNQACASHCAAAPHVVLLTDSESTDSDSDCDASATSTALPADEAAGAAPAPPRPVAATLWDPLVLHACCHYGIACFLFVLFNEVVPLLLKAGADKGGFSFESAQIGMALAVSGVALFFTALLVAPAAAKRWGNLRTYRGTLLSAAVFFGSFPLLTLLRGSRTVMWIMIGAAMTMRSFLSSLCFLPVMIMVNNSAPSAELGTVNGIGQSLGSLARTVGPALGGALWALGESHTGWPFHQGWSFLLLSMVALAAFAASLRMPLALNKPHGEV